MSTLTEYTHSHLFTIRIWPESLDEGEREWRGQVRHVISGETYYFREWPMLVSLLVKMLPEDDNPGWTASR
ncbi:MAG TPA: hypothetical protein VLY63_09245 [Anaerolineae bacterium]|nr:hypothetical protein [Anaerolineae bacterium]